MTSQITLRALRLLWFLALALLLPQSATAQSTKPEDEPIADVIPAFPIPTKAPPTTKATAKPDPPRGIKPATPRPALPRPTTKPTAKPTATERPAPKPTAKAAPTKPAVPLNAASQNPEDAPIEDAPIEDQPIPDTPAAAGMAPGVLPSAAPARRATPGPQSAAKSVPAIRGQHDAEETPIADALPVEATEEADLQSEVNPWSLSETFQQDFMRHALVAGVIMALMCSFMGVYVVLKRIVFVGVALAEVSSTGIALAILLGFAPLLGAIGFMVLGVTLLSIHWSPRRVPHDSYIGIIYSIAAALSVLFLAKSATGETQMLKLLQGDVLTVSMPETWQMAAAFMVVALLHVLFNKEFLMVSFDRDVAATLGFCAGAWDYLLFLTIGVTIAFSIRTAGVLMASAMLILPAVTALLLTTHLRRAWLLAPGLGVLPVVAGLHLSFVWDLPSSAVIVLLSFLLLLPALAWHAVKQRA